MNSPEILGNSRAGPRAGRQLGRVVGRQQQRDARHRTSVRPKKGGQKARPSQRRGREPRSRLAHKKRPRSHTHRVGGQLQRQLRPGGSRGQRVRGSSRTNNRHEQQQRPSVMPLPRALAARVGRGVARGVAFRASHPSGHRRALLQLHGRARGRAVARERGWRRALQVDGSADAVGAARVGTVRTHCLAAFAFATPPHARETRRGRRRSRARGLAEYISVLMSGSDVGF